MAVLIEAVSVVVRIAALDQQFSGGWDAFRELIPSGTSCMDGRLIRVGFTDPADADSFVEAMGQHGLTYLRDGKAIDLVIVDQLHGPTTPCDWIEFGTVDIRGSTVAACRSTGDETQLLYSPDGWTFEGSLSQTSASVPALAVDNSATGAVRPQDIAELLASEAEAWLNSATTKAGIPRALFGITERNQKFLLPLNTNLLGQGNRSRFLRWLCQGLVAYAYVTHVRRHNENDDPGSTGEGIDIYASSMTRDVTVTMSIGRQSDGSLVYWRDHRSSAAASDDPGMFAGLQRTTVEFEEQEAAEFGEIWRELATIVQWLQP